MIERAQWKAAELPKLNNSITKGGGNLAGFLGEELVLASSERFTEANTYDYDIVLDSRYSIEVKTKRQTSKLPPKSTYEASITNFNPYQLTDYYIFTRVTNDYSIGWVLGIISKNEFFNKASFHRKGELDTTNNFEFKCDCYNLPYSDLGLELP